MSLTDDELDKLLEELLGDDFRHTDEAWEPDPPDPMDLLASAVNDALSGAAPLSPPLVGNSNPIQKVRAEPLLDGVQRLGRDGFGLMCRHPEMVLVYDLETYEVDGHRVEDLPLLFTTNPNKPQAFWCADDVESLKEAKTKAMLIMAEKKCHVACPVLIAPPRATTREAQHTAVFTTVWWHHDSKTPDVLKHDDHTEDTLN